MTFHDSNKELFKKLSEEHEKAQIAAKQAERYNDALPVPPLKELRDVLHHVILSLTLSPKDQEAELHKAISHCKRAYFDSKECIFQYLINNVEAIKEKIHKKDGDLVGQMASEGTTPRRLTDLIGSLCDLTSGSGDKGTPVVYVQGYFDNYTTD